MEHPELTNLINTIESLDAREDKLSMDDGGIDQKVKQINDYKADAIRIFSERTDSLLDELSNLAQRRDKDIKENCQQIAHAKNILKGAAELGQICFANHEDLALKIWRESEVVKNIPEPDLEIRLSMPDDFKMMACNFGSVSYRDNISSSNTNTVPVQQELVSTMKHKFTNIRNMVFIQNILYICDVTKGAILTVDSGIIGKLNCEIAKPCGIAYDEYENTLIVTVGNSVKKVSLEGEVQNVAGKFGTEGYFEGSGKNAKFFSPSGVVVDNETNNYVVADTGNHLIRVVTREGNVSTLAGSTRGYLDGPTDKSKFAEPVAIALNERARTIYVCDRGNNLIRKIANGQVSTVCEIVDPHGIALDDMGRIYVTSKCQNKIYRISRSERGECNVEHFAGSGLAGDVDGPRLQAKFYRPWGISINNNVLYFIDDRSKLRKIPLEEKYPPCN